MTLPDRDVVMSWVGLSVEDAEGGQVGSCTAVYIDDATGVPEWALVQAAGDAGLRFLPLLDAREDGGTLRVPFAAELIDTAPRVGSQGHLSEADEAELYEHYGVDYSAGPSNTLLPAAVSDDVQEAAPEPEPELEPAAQSVPVDETPEEAMEVLPPQPEPLPTPEPVLPSPMPEPLLPTPAPEPPQPSPAPQPSEPSPTPGPPRPAPPSIDYSPGGRIRLPAEGVVAGVAGATAAAWLLLRERRRGAAPKPSPRPLVRAKGGARRAPAAKAPVLLQHGVRSVGTAVTGAAGRVTGVADALGSEVTRASGQLGKATAGAAHSGARAASDAAASGVRAAADVAGGVKDSAAESRRQVRRSRRAARRSWRRTVRRGIGFTGLGAGYVLGARAGQQRYAQLRSTATRLSDRLRER